MRLKWWVVALAMVLALGCGEEKRSVGGNDGRDIELGDPLNATPAGSEAAKRDALINAHKTDCRVAAEKLCKWRSGRNSTPYTQQQLDECVVKKIADCEEGGQ